MADKILTEREQLARDIFVNFFSGEEAFTDPEVLANTAFYAADIFFEKVKKERGYE